MATREEKTAFSVGLAVASAAASRVFATLAKQLNSEQLLDALVIDFRNELDADIQAVGVDDLIRIVPNAAPQRVVTMEDLIEQIRN